jgi:tetraacyldisaccharide 4'-kinase
MLDPYGAPPRQPRDAATVAVAAIARPERFFADLAAGGWNVADRIAFPDHHAYSIGDVARVADRLRGAGAALVLTTEKDVVRWMPLMPLPFPLAWVPEEVDVEPAEPFARLVLEAVRGAAPPDLGPGGATSR